MLPFWSGGRRRHLRALKKEEKTLLAALQRRLAAEPDPAAREELRSQINATREEFDQKRREAQAALFAEP